MLPDRISNPGPLTYESGAQPIALRGPAFSNETSFDRIPQDLLLPISHMILVRGGIKKF